MAGIPINIAEHVGRTPMVGLTRILDGTAAGVELYAKLEAFNPGGRGKDRIGGAVGEGAGGEGRVEPGGGTNGEGAGGNTRNAPALRCAAEGDDPVLPAPHGTGP